MRYDRDYHKFLILTKPAGWLNIINNWEPEPPKKKWADRPSERERLKYVEDQKAVQRAKEERKRERQEDLDSRRIIITKVNLLG